MNNLRHAFPVAIVLLAPLMPTARNPEPPAAKAYRAYVGNYTTKTESKGIYQFRFDPATGRMSALELAVETKDPSWVIVHPGGKYLYAANEMDHGSTISAFSIDPPSGLLTLLNSRPADGEGPCHLAFDRTGKLLHRQRRGVSDSGGRQTRRADRFGQEPGPARPAPAPGRPARPLDRHIP